MRHLQSVDLHNGVRISQLGLGAAALAGLFSSVSVAESNAVVRSALDSGITYFDTAPHYGKGTSERRLGAALAQTPRESFVISTKVGRLLVPGDGSNDPDFADADPEVVRIFDFSADGVRRSLEESLTRLGTDHVEMVLIHDPDDHADQAIHEAFPALADLRRQGVVKAIGVGMNQSEIPARFIRETSIDFVLIAGRYTLLDQSASLELLPTALEHGVDVIAAGVFNSGILADPVAGAHFHYVPAKPAVLAYAQAMESILLDYGVTLKEAAIQFPMQHPAIKAVLVGCRSASEVRTNVAAFNKEIPENAWQAVASFISTSGGLHG